MDVGYFTVARVSRPCVIPSNGGSPVRRAGTLAVTFTVIAVALATATARAAGPAATRPAAGRSFLFTYAATVTGLRPGQPGRVWLPVPASDVTQDVELADSQGVPADVSIGNEPRFGNRIESFALPADHGTSYHFTQTYRVRRREVAWPIEQCPVSAGAAMSDPAALLRPDARVPVGGEPTRTLLAHTTLPADPVAAAQVLFDVVDDHMQYRKDKPGWGTGDATWACQSGFGNCTDFHSLFISLARTDRLPAVFQIGFPVGPGAAGAVKGYHCWAWYRCGDGWSPVDISEANLHPEKRAYYFGHLDADRVAFTVGRDLELVPKQAGPPLNFFVYPYVEVDGKPVPQERIDKAFSYRQP